MDEQLDILAKRDNQLMVVTKASEFAHVIAHTNLGELRLKLGYGGTGKDYIFVMDAVPLSSEQNEQLFKLLENILFKPLID